MCTNRASHSWLRPATGELLVVTGPVLVECLPSIVSAPQYYEQRRCWGAEVGGIGFVLANAMHVLSYNN